MTAIRTAPHISIEKSSCTSPCGELAEAAASFALPGDPLGGVGGLSSAILTQTEISDSRKNVARYVAKATGLGRNPAQESHTKIPLDVGSTSSAQQNRHGGGSSQILFRAHCTVTGGRSPDISGHAYQVDCNEYVNAKVAATALAVYTIATDHLALDCSRPTAGQMQCLTLDWPGLRVEWLLTEYHTLCGT